MRARIAGLVAVLGALLPALAHAQAPDPLRLVPASAEAVVKIESPLAFYQAVYEHEAFQELLKIDAVASFYDTTVFRRGRQIIAFVEKELGHSQLALLDKLSGGGVVIAARFEKNAALAVI